VTAEVVDGAPTPTEHDLLAWTDIEGLRDLDWLEPDVPFLDELEVVLRERQGE